MFQISALITVTVSHTITYINCHCDNFGYGIDVIWAISKRGIQGGVDVINLGIDKIIVPTLIRLNMPVKSSQNLYWPVSELMLFFYFAYKWRSKMQYSLHSPKEIGHFCTCIPVADLDFELRRGQILLYLSSRLFFLQSFLLFSPKVRRGPGPPGPSPRSATVNTCTSLKGDQLYKGLVVN